LAALLAIAAWPPDHAIAHAQASPQSLIDAPQPTFDISSPTPSPSLSFTSSDEPVSLPTIVTPPFTTTPNIPPNEHFHWKGALLQAFSFEMLSNATRIMTADQSDRHLLLNKPFWSDYWASLGQFNMRRWNDGDSFPVNYIGHPMEGAIAGYIEIQNDPRGRNLRLSRDKDYWHSRERAFFFSLAYSTQWEIGPFGETAIFNQGGFTYPIRCNKHVPASVPGSCLSTNATYTNNTGWVDFIITPIVGTLWVLGEDAIDRYISDPLVDRHPNNFGLKLARASLNPPRSLANILRGHYPWWQDYEHPGQYQSTMITHFDRWMEEEPRGSIEIFPHYTTVSLLINRTGCLGCRTATSGIGIEADFLVRRYLDIVVDVDTQPHASPLSSPNVGGSLFSGTLGLRSGYSGQHFALKATLAPGFASYSHATGYGDTVSPNPPTSRNYNFAAAATLAGDLRFSQHYALRATLTQTVIRYRSPVRDPPGIGTPPNLSFLSHDNYVNTTNWGFEVGPVFRF
jgi:hypothetical protein